MIKLPDDFSEIRIKKAKLWIDRVMLDMPGMKEAKTCAAILEFVAEVQRLNATAQPVSDWQREAERMAEQHGMSFVLFRNGEEPKCADPTKVRIEFTDKCLGYPAAPGVQDD